MLLKKYDGNNEALKQIGQEAIAERHRLGLPISAKDLKGAKHRPQYVEKFRVLNSLQPSCIILGGPNG
nr:hypothetical protein [uncultured Shinella sp.]